MVRVNSMSAVLPLLFAGCAAPSIVSVSVNPRILSYGVRTVAVLPFEGVPVTKEVEEYSGWWLTSVKDNGAVISDLLTTELMCLPGYEYLERSQVRRIVDEQDLSVTDLISQKTATEIGELLGADAVVLGKVNRLQATSNILNMRDCYVSLSARMVHTKTGTVLWSASTQSRQKHTRMLQVAREQCACIARELKAGLTSASNNR